MKYFTILVVCFLPALTGNLIAQKNFLHAGLLYLPTTQGDVGFVSLGYFHSIDKKRTPGLRLMYHTTAFDRDDDDIIFSAVNLDAVMHWNLSKSSRRARWSAEAGVSAAVITLKYPPFELYLDDPVSPEQLQELQEYAAHWHQSTGVYPGIATSISWQYTLNKHWRLGAEIISNIYFPTNDQPRLIVPDICTTYVF